MRDADVTCDGDDVAGLRDAYRACPHAVLGAAPDGRVLFANPAAEALFGLSEAALCRRAAETLELPGGGGLQRIADPVSGLDLLFAEAADEAQRLHRAWQHEAHERRLTADQLRLTQRVFETTGEAILITDPDAFIIDINEAFTRITGYSRHEAIGQKAGFTKSGHHDAAFYEGMWRTLHERGEWTGEIWDRHKSGRIFPKKVTISCIRDDDGAVVNYIGVFSDITEVKEQAEKVRQLAYFDPLTGLPNRSLFRDRLQQALQAARRSGTRVAVLFVDLDGFKRVNDTLGHRVGDELLREVSWRVGTSLRSSDTIARLGRDGEAAAEVARFGGDEFTVVATGLSHGGGAATVAERIIEAIAQPMIVDDNEVSVTASIGIAVFPQDGDEADTIIGHAENAMHRAKELGRSGYEFFTEAMTEASRHRLSIEHGLRKGLKDGAFELFYQPKVDANSLQVVGMEALVRWRRGDGVLVSPLDFIPVAEETGIIKPLGEWILNEACRQNREWLDRGRALRVAVNLSARQFADAGLVPMVETTLQATGLPPEMLELEITESMVLGDIEATTRTLERLRDLGVHVSIDDFGTGYSSLSLLKRLPLDSMKIDRSFVRDMTEDSEDDAIVSAILAMGRKLGLQIVAEGVENRDQLMFLAQRGCDQLQGYLFSKPIPATLFGTFPIDQESLLETGGRAD